MFGDEEREDRLYTRSLLRGPRDDFDGEFAGDISKLAGIVGEQEGLTGYAAIVARELGIPMVGAATLPDVSDGTEVTIDGERGVVYAGPVEDTNRP